MAKTYTKPPEMVIDPKTKYTATFKLEKGDVVVELFADKAPRTVNNFVFLAREGFYDGVMFHRVITGFMAQGGDPTGTGGGAPGYTFEDEFDPSLRFDRPGLLAMANRGPDTNGGQFFITYAATPHLDGLHTIFGEVIEGAEVLDDLTPRDPQANPDFPGDRLISVEITETEG
jgi:cyclophilin family peptidyl-prolyl cis-trans isomerase